MTDQVLPAIGNEVPVPTSWASLGKPAGRATLRDVAVMAGVSKGTVSRVLSGNDGAVRISAETAARVREAAETLDYQPNAAARALGRRRTETIAFVIPSAGPQHQYRRFSNLKISELLSGIDEATAARGYNVILQVTAGNPLADSRHQRIWKSRAVDGAIWLAQPLSAELAELPFPVVAINCGESEELSVGTVNTDEYGGSLIALAHLAQLGHERVAHIAGPADIWSARERLRAYRDFVSGQSGALRIEAGDGFEQSGMSAVGRLLEDHPAPTALFVAGDRMAVGAMTELRARGLNLPNDMAVIGADGMDLVNYSFPKLTTVASRMADATQRAVEMLIDLIERPTPTPRRVIAATELVILDSCGYRLGNHGAPPEIVIRSARELEQLSEPLDSPLDTRAVRSSGD